MDLPIKEALKLLISKRVEFVLADARTYIFVRMNGMLQREDMGGGNFATAYSQFALINFLAKTHYYIDRPDRFIKKTDVVTLQQHKRNILSQLDGSDKRFAKKWLRIPRALEVNEEDAFLHFAHNINNAGVNLYVPRTNQSEENDGRIIWKGFRNNLAHLAMVQQGKGIQTFTFEEYWDWQENSDQPLDTKQILNRVRKKAGKEPVFQWNGDGWMMNIDILTALLEDIQRITNDRIDETDLTQQQLRQLLLLIEPQ